MLQTSPKRAVSTGRRRKRSKREPIFTPRGTRYLLALAIAVGIGFGLYFAAAFSRRSLSVSVFSQSSLSRLYSAGGKARVGFGFLAARKGSATAQGKLFSCPTCGIEFKIVRAPVNSEFHNRRPRIDLPKVRRASQWARGEFRPEALSCWHGPTWHCPLVENSRHFAHTSTWHGGRPSRCCRRGERCPTHFSAVSRKNKGPTYAGPPNLLLPLAFGVSLLAVLASVLECCWALVECSLAFA